MSLASFVIICCGSSGMWVTLYGQMDMVDWVCTFFLPWVRSRVGQAPWWSGNMGWTPFATFLILTEMCLNLLICGICSVVISLLLVLFLRSHLWHFHQYKQCSLIFNVKIVSSWSSFFVGAGNWAYSVHSRQGSPPLAQVDALSARAAGSEETVHWDTV